jgi:hypothetical protein
VRHRYPQELRERIVGALGAVLAVALVIGLVAGAVAWAAVHATGLDDQPASAGEETPSTPVSSRSTPSPSASPAEQQTGKADPKPTKTARPSTPTKHRHHARRHHGQLTLTVSRRHVSPMGRVDLGGRYAGHDGATLVVQRREAGHWSRFPVSVTVRGGSFRTWVASGQHGPNTFRVLDPATGRVSGSVTVVVG